MESHARWRTDSASWTSVGSAVCCCAEVARCGAGAGVIEGMEVERVSLDRRDGKERGRSRVGIYRMETEEGKGRREGTERRAEQNRIERSTINQCPSRPDRYNQSSRNLPN